ncbi:CBS domain-containing protein [Micromonospora sp. IBHARD004]|uniref:CBS domain-containing protein n=1 Tax=Micromonospora sp. IBHARD004 TaxID=3457764 RepID=UPI004058789C
MPADVRALEGPEELAERVAADPDSPVTLTVRDFIGLWGMVSRSRKAIETIRAGLAEFGLSTMPPFTEVSIDSEITVLPIGEAPEPHRYAKGDATADLDLEPVEPDDLGPESVETPQESDQEAAATASMPLMLTVGRIPSARRPVTTIKLSDQISRAIDLMAANDFDQLPVMGADDHVCGTISWREIAATARPTKALVAEATIQLVRSVRTNDSLVDCLDVVADHGCVVVLAPNGKLSGIITRHDLAHRFAAEVRPYAMLEEVERRLRRAIAVALRRIKDETGAYALPGDEARIQKLTTKGMNFSDYIDLLKRPEVWTATGWMFSRDSFTDRLDRVRQIRNTTMHFHDTDDDRDGAFAEISTVLSMLKTVDPQL